MPSSLTSETIRELEGLLWNSRRSISEIYREWRTGATVDEMAKARNHSDLKKIKDTISSLRVLFGRESLPARGKGRQQTINEAAHWLNSDSYLSPELTHHLEIILTRGERTNTRRADGYEPPVVRRSVYSQAREVARQEGDVAGVYVITRKAYRDATSPGQPFLMKLGWSTNVWDRITNAQTWDPEPLEVLRVYPCANPNFVEGKLHIVLDTLGCNHEGGGGKEWFMASLGLIDSMAAALELVDEANVPAKS